MVGTHFEGDPREVRALDAYIKLCTDAGYDTSATRELQLYSNYLSVLAPKYVAGVYEFCKPKQ